MYRCRVSAAGEADGQPDENETFFRTRSSEAGSKLIAALADALSLLVLTGDAYAELSEYQQVDYKGHSKESV